MSTVSSVPRVDFSHAFAPPHRITVAPPDSGDKTLVDCEPGLVSLSWSYDTLLDFSVANFHGPLTQWKLDFQAVIDGRKVEQNTWRRLDDWLPGLAAAFIHPAVRTTIEVIGAQRAAIMRVEFTNLDRQAAHRATLECSVPGNWRGVLPAFVDPGLAQNARDAQRPAADGFHREFGGQIKAHFRQFLRTVRERRGPEPVPSAGAACCPGPVVPALSLPTSFAAIPSRTATSFLPVPLLP